MKRLTILTAVVLLTIGISGNALADSFTSTMSDPSIIWSTFSLYGFSGGPLSAPTSNSNVGFDDNVPTPFPVAIKVDFSQLNMNPTGIGSVTPFSIGIEDLSDPSHLQRVELSYFFANQVDMGGGVTLNAAGLVDQYPKNSFHLPPPITFPSVIASGALGLLYDGNGHVWVGFNLGGGWQTLEEVSLPSPWPSSDQFIFGVNAGVVGSGSMSVNIDDILISHPTCAVPEPATMLLLGFGIIGLAGARKFRQ